MKPISLFAAVCLFSSVLAAQTTSSFHFTGESASAVATVNGTHISLDAFSGSTTAFVSYFSTTQNPDGSITETFAFGNIPSGVFSAGGTERVSLDVDTSQIPGFQSTSCTFSFTPFFTSSCSPGPLGVIQVDWANNRITSSSVLVERHVTSGGSLTMDAHIDAGETSADAAGSFLGLSFSVADSAAINLNRDTTITITQ